MDQLSAVARDPGGYVEGWRARHPGRLVLGVLPMNFPRELALAAGTLPVVVQDDQKPVTEGRSLLAEFYCGYTRNLADQAATGRFDRYDAVLMADHCISSGPRTWCGRSSPVRRCSSGC
jgi:benzoyl-CoA reductase subunit C